MNTDKLTEIIKNRKKYKENSKDRDYPMIGIEEVISEIIEYFKTKKEVIAVYLFGSYVKEKQHKGSDLDIAVLVSNKRHSNYSVELFNLVRGIEIEVKVLNKASVFFQFQVLKSGKKIYCSNEKLRIRYEANVMSEYQDFKPYIDYYNQCMYQHIKEGSYGHRL